MTALAITLGVGLFAATGGVLTLALLGRRDSAQLRDVVDLLDGQRKLVAEYKHKFDIEFVAHGVTSKRLEQERNLRAIAETQRNETQRKCRAYLAQNLRGATKDEINEVLASLFTVGLSVVPAPPTRRSDHPTDGLIDPTGEM